MLGAVELGAAGDFVAGVRFDVVAFRGGFGGFGEGFGAGGGGHCGGVEGGGFESEEGLDDWRIRMSW